MKKRNHQALATAALAGTLIPLVAPLQHVQAATTNQTHTVKAGENLYRIGLAYNVSVDQLRAWNGMKASETTIKVGQKLIVGKKNSSSTPSIETPPKPGMGGSHTWGHWYKENVSVKPAGEYVTKTGHKLPLVLEMKSTHPDFLYYIDQGMHVKNTVYLYLQTYKSDTYYYSPIIRDKATTGMGLGGKVNSLTAEILRRLKGTPYYPHYAHTEEKLRLNTPSLRSNPFSHEPSGNHPIYNNTQNDVASTVRNLNHKRRNGMEDMNFRQFTAPLLVTHNFTPQALIKTSLGYQGKHSDSYQLHDGSKKWGEFRQLGYFTSGQPFHNPYFPVDGMRNNGGKGFEDYPLMAFPWTHPKFRDTALHSEMDELTFQWAMHKGMFGLSKTGANKHLYNLYYQPKTDMQAAKRAYDDKMQAMRQLYEKSPKVRENMKRAENGGYTDKEKAVHALAVLYASLTSEPLGLDESLSVLFAYKYPLTDNALGKQVWYSIPLTLPGDKRAGVTQDTQIRKQTILLNGKPVQTFTRDAKGNTKLDTKVAPEVEPGQTIKVVTDVVMVTPYRNALQKNLTLKTSSGLKENYERVGGGVIRKDAPNTFEYTMTIPEMEGPMTVTGLLDKTAYLRTFDMLYESIGNIAENKLNVIIDRGNFVAEKVEMVAKDGTVVSDPTPGHAYKLRYVYKYVSVNGKDARRNTKVRVDYNIGRQMVGATLHGRDDSGTTSTKTLTMKPKHNQTYAFESDYHIFETGQVDTTATVVVGEDRYDQNKKDNTHANRWESEYDIRVQNVRVVPSESTNGQVQKGQSLVQFDVEYQVPSFVDELGQDVSFLVSVDGKTISTEQHIRSGMNRNLSIPMDVDLSGADEQVVKAAIFANHTREVYETDIATQENNKGTGQAMVTAPKVTPFKDNNRKETWKQYVETNKWKGEPLSYKTFTKKAASFIRFTSKDTIQSAFRDVSEGYQIDAVWFRSRLTRDEEMGPQKDGWVNLLKEDGVIRAGYGYELKMDVSYDTNALDQDFENKVGVDGVWTRPSLIRPILQDNIYVEMPDGTIRSVQGDGGTEKALRVKEKITKKGQTTWTFDIEGDSKLGADTVGRFYIGEDVKDGRYPLNVFTPKITGISGKMTSDKDARTHLLFDSRPDLGIKVIGASVDDVTDHINR